MKITKADWEKYRDTMSGLSKKAAKEFRDHFFKDGVETLEGYTREEVIKYAYELIQKYADASSELACQMHERMAELAKRKIKAAVPAEVAKYGEVARAVNGSLIQSETGQLVEQVVSRYVKQAGADTTLKNAKRDSAEFAWIPAGNSCAFCIMLASNGWQPISKAAMDGNHAEHIHANCECEFAIRFDTKTDVSGYEPETYRKMYQEASESRNSAVKMRALRRTQDEKRENSTE